MATIVALLTEQGVNMGDHAETVTTAIEVDPEEQVGALLERTLTRRVWTPDDPSARGPRLHSSIELRLAVPAEQVP